MNSSDPDPQLQAVQPPKKRKILRWLVLFVLVLAGAAAYGIVGRNSTDAKLAQWTDDRAVPSVDLVMPKHPTEGQQLVLPAAIEAYYLAPIHARVNGYVKMWYYDIGAHVKSGTVLAVIDTPELDQQVVQAQGEVEKAQANLSLAELTAERWKSLRVSQAVSQQTADEKAGDALARKADLAAAKANLDRLKAMMDFKKIVAPFDGTVTARRIDVGALVSSTGSDQPGLFDVAATHEMRVYVRVPQIYVSRLHEGMTVSLRLPQFPNRVFPAKLETTSTAISQQSLALLVELSAENPGGLLNPGAYAQATFDLPLDSNKLVIPSSAIVFRGSYPEVATVDAQGKVMLKKIDILIDTGSSVEIASGVSDSDRIIVSPSDSVSDGDAVHITTIEGKPVEAVDREQQAKGAS